MRMAIVIGLLLLNLVAHAQCDTTRKDHKWLEIGLITTSVVTNALGDGLNSRTKYSQGHFLCSVSVLSLLAIPFVVRPTWKFPLTYILIRYSLFDSFYNIGANRKLSYIGGRNYYDEGANRIPTSVFNASKIASLGMVIFINTHKKHENKSN